MFKITPRNNRGVLEGPLSAQIEEALQSKYVWYDPEDLTNEKLFYAETAMYLGVMYDMAAFINDEFDMDCTVELPELNLERHDWTFNWEFRPRQEDAVNLLIEKRYGIAHAPPGFGKCLGKDTPVLMFDGTTKLVQDIRQGDVLMGPDSRPRFVLTITTGQEELFKVVPKYGESFICNRSHILSLRISCLKSSGLTRRYGGSKLVNISVDEFLKLSKSAQNSMKLWYSPALEFTTQPSYVVPAYILGTWLGDGHRHSNTLTTQDSEIVDAWVDYAKTLGYTFDDVGNAGCAKTYNLKSGGRPNFFKKFLNDTGLKNQKHIPVELFTASINERLELLAGLIDTDGSVVQTTYEITSKHKILADGIVKIARSLGFRATANASVKECTNTGSKGVYINGDVTRIPVRVPHKKAQQRTHSKDILRTGFTVESVGPGTYYGFEIGGPDRLFLLGSNLVTHNTVVASAVTAKIGYRTAIIVQAEEPLNQAYHTLLRATNIKPGRISGEHKKLAEVTVYMVQTLSQELENNPDGEIAQWYRSAKVIIVDECFPAGTLVDNKPIQNYKVGDLVRAYDHKTDQIVLSKITAVFKHKPKTLVRVKFQDGTYQDCTAMHPFWTGEGYTPAALLNSTCMVYTSHHASAMSLVPKEFFSREKTSKIQTQNWQTCLLFHRLRETISRKTIKFKDERNQSQICVRANETQQSYVQKGINREDACNTTRNKSQTTCAGWQWAWFNFLREQIIKRTSYRFCRSRNYINQTTSWYGIPDALQMRPNVITAAFDYRGRRGVTFEQSTSESRSEKNTILTGKGVESVTFHEPTSEGNFGGLCPDGFVYNLEVEDHHNYFVNDILVHNCHHAGASSYMTVLDAPDDPHYVIGLSATPNDREDGKQDFVHAFFGKSLFEITFGQQIEDGTACPLTVYVDYIPPRDFGFTSKRTSGADWQRRQQYTKVYDQYVINNAERNRLGVQFAREMNEDGLTVAMIVSRVEHAEVLHNLMPEATIITSKTKNRDEIIYKLKRHEIKCVITTLFDEAVDVPSLGAVALLAGGKSKIKLKQRLRSTRVFDGDTVYGRYTKDRGYVWFPFDQCDFLRSHSQSNLAILKDLVSQHPDNELILLK
jgi:superfamily II DNA or RNA helicase